MASGPIIGETFFGKHPLELLDVFEHTGPRPIEVRSILENNEDVGIAKHGLRPNGLYMRSGQ